MANIKFVPSNVQNALATPFYHFGFWWGMYIYIDLLTWSLYFQYALLPYVCQIGTVHTELHCDLITMKCTSHCPLGLVSFHSLLIMPPSYMIVWHIYAVIQYLLYHNQQAAGPPLTTSPPAKKTKQNWAQIYFVYTFAIVFVFYCLMG